jgi:hypothetical protein
VVPAQGTDTGAVVPVTSFGGERRHPASDRSASGAPITRPA